MISLLDIPHQEARRRVKSGAPVYLTVNPVEYHGPHLSLHNDRLISIGLVREVHEALGKAHDWPLLVGADLEVGVEPCPGPGTRRTAYPIVRHLVLEACRALVELGATRVILMTFHGAPLHNLAIEAGVSLLRTAGVRAVAPFNGLLNEMLFLEPAKFADAFAHVTDVAERTQMMGALANDFHAGFFETSMALHYAPESVAPDYMSLPPCPDVRPAGAMALAARMARALGRDRLSRELTFAAEGMGWNALRPFPGYTGRPHRATPQAGAVFAAEIVRRYVAGIEDVFAGRAESPPPIMRWVGTLSLGGRIGNLPVPSMAEMK
ncbi:MAG TPA: creatininase family protein [Polyangia bacterium]|nr:creatininase family protein [Polyangia bacterium]